MSLQTADEYALDIVEAFRGALQQRINQADMDKLRENINADVEAADVQYIARELIAKPDWFPEIKK